MKAHKTEFRFSLGIDVVAYDMTEAYLIREAMGVLTDNVCHTTVQSGVDNYGVESWMREPFS